MTTRTRDQAAARSLARLTGAPYQSCLAAVSVLRRVPRETDKEELFDVLDGSEPWHHVTLRLDEQGDVERALEAMAAPWVQPEAAILMTRLEDDATLFLTEVVLPQRTMPSGMSLLVDDIHGAPFPRHGVWRTDSRTWTRACRSAVRTGSDDWSVDVTASRLDPSLAPSRDFPHVGIDADMLHTAEAQETVVTSEFLWWRFSFAALGVDVDYLRYRSSKRGWREEEDKNAPLMAELLDQESIVVPDVLVSTWRELAAVVPPTDNWPFQPDWHWWDGGHDAPSWYGLELPDYSILWARVAPGLRPATPT